MVCASDREPIAWNLPVTPIAAPRGRRRRSRPDPCVLASVLLDASADFLNAREALPPADGDVSDDDLL